MDRRSALRVGRVAFALLDVVAIAVQLLDLAGRGTLNPVSYFSYFTIESNLIAIFALLLAASYRENRTARVDMIRGGAVVYMTVTCVVFTLLLSNTDVDTAIPWVNTVVHQLIPLVMIVDWLLDPPPARLNIRQGLQWLSYPAVWIVYILIRGSIVGLYPYPFLNPANGGYGTVSLYGVGILVLMTLVCAATVAAANAAGGRMPAAEGSA
jgi:hypothetical protein